MLTQREIRFTLSLLVALLIGGDTLEGYAQDTASDGPTLLAERSRQSRRRRSKRTPSPVPRPSATNGGAEDDAGVVENADAAPEEDGVAEEQPYETEVLTNGENGENGDVGETGQGESEEGAESEPFGSDAQVSDTSGTSLRRSNRLDFDERLIKGQGARSGAVYLFKRTPRKLPELVSLRTSYRERIVEPILGHQRLVSTPQPTKSPSTAETPTIPEGEEGAPPENAEETQEEGPSKAELARQRRRRARLRSRQRRRRRAQQKAQ